MFNMVQKKSKKIEILQAGNPILRQVSSAIHINKIKTTEIKNIPIICLTAKAMKEDYENALKNGANDYLSKPVDEDKLFAMLKIWLYKK